MFVRGVERKEKDGSRWFGKGNFRKIGGDKGITGSNLRLTVLSPLLCQDRAPDRHNLSYFLSDSIFFSVFLGEEFSQKFPENPRNFSVHVCVYRGLQCQQLERLGLMNWSSSNWSGTFRNRNSWVWGASLERVRVSLDSLTLLVPKSILIHPEDKCHLWFHYVVYKILFGSTYKEMKGSCTLSLVFCYIRGFNYLIILKENEDSNIKGSFHATVFPLMNLTNMQSDVIRCSSCLLWEWYST